MAASAKPRRTRLWLAQPGHVAQLLSKSEDIRELESPGRKVREKVRESGGQSGGRARQTYIREADSQIGGG